MIYIMYICIRNKNKAIMSTYNYKNYDISYQEDSKEWIGFGNDEAIRAKLKRDIIKAINNDNSAKITSREWI